MPIVIILLHQLMPHLIITTDNNQLARPPQLQSLLPHHAPPATLTLNRPLPLLNGVTKCMLCKSGGTNGVMLAFPDPSQS